MKTTSETAKIHQIGEVQSGTSKAGKYWQKCEVVFDIEENTDSHRYVAITFFGDEVDMLNEYQEGDEVDVSYYASSREWNGRWYTDLKLSCLVRKEAVVPMPEPKAEPKKRATPKVEESLEPQSDDLPF